MPLFSCDSKEFEKLHKNIGNKAANKIQTNFRKHLKQGAQITTNLYTLDDKNFTSCINYDKIGC